VTPWTVAYKVPLSMGFSRQEYWSGLPFLQKKVIMSWITIMITKILKEMEIPDHHICLLRNLYAGQEATVRTGHGKTVILNWERSTSRLYIVTLLT